MQRIEGIEEILRYPSGGKAALTGVQHRHHQPSGRPCKAIDHQERQANLSMNDTAISPSSSVNITL